MENIFEGAKFGDKFKTRDGRKAVFGWEIEKPEEWKGYSRYIYWIEGLNCLMTCDEFGISEQGPNKNMYPFIETPHDYDIVSKYVEPIDEDKLDELAEKTHPLRYNSFGEADELDVAFQDGFKVGFRKAKEE